MNAAELASYDQIKTFMCKTFPTVNPDAKMLHFFCGLAAGFLAVVCASPVDVIKTRVMNVIITLTYRILRLIKVHMTAFRKLSESKDLWPSIMVSMLTSGELVFGTLLCS
jgi:hypothetical protein